MRPRCTGGMRAVRVGLTATLAVAVVAVGGCSRAKPAAEPIAWEPERRVAGAMAPGATMVLVEGAVPAMQPPWRPVRWPNDSLACAGSYVSARGRADTLVAVWRRSSGPLTRMRFARSPNGGVSWDSSVAVGRVEQDPRACRRPPAGIAFDSTRGVAHVVYFGAAERATGIVTTRVTGAGISTPPEIVAPGAVPALAAIAALGDTTAIVFEAPVRPGGVVWLALTISASQITRVRVPLSPPGVPSFMPAVALGGRRVGTAWNEGRQGSREPHAVARVGRITR